MSIIANRGLITINNKDNGKIWSLDIPSFSLENHTDAYGNEFEVKNILKDENKIYALSNTNYRLAMVFNLAVKRYVIKGKLYVSTGGAFFGFSGNSLETTSYWMTNKLGLWLSAFNNTSEYNWTIRVPYSSKSPSYNDGTITCRLYALTNITVPDFIEHEVVFDDEGYDKMYVNGLLLAERKTNRSYKTNILTFDSANTANTGGFELHSLDVYYE
jgi:hypothetical protein